MMTTSVSHRESTHVSDSRVTTSRRAEGENERGQFPHRVDSDGSIVITAINPAVERLVELLDMAPGGN
jgi:hypothetical protein